ncbi:MAG TPA: pyridoxamine 5'-phosphate oxidase family protein [Xanthobacteraceae bacterium]|jgi:general stress protein 26
MSESDIDRVWEIMDDVPICMVTTHAGAGMRTRPMHAIPDRAAGCIYFITDTRGAKDDEIATAPDVCLAFADVDDNTYLGITGRATMMRDPAKAQELWSSEAQAWWPRGPGDPTVRVMSVEPDEAEYWDTRGNSITVALKLMAARVRGRQPDLGDNKKVNLR